MNEGAAGVSKKSHAGDDRGIPPFKKRRVGHPAVELVPMPVSMKASDLKRKPPFGELMRNFIVECPDHGQIYVQGIGHHISTIPKKSKKGKK